MTTYAFAGEFAGALLDGAGRPRRSVAVTVLKAGVPATLYTDRTKTAQASNPVSTDSRGNVRFFADPGDYTIDGSPITVPVDPAEAVGATVQPINFWPVGSEANMLALAAHPGDIAVRLDINRNFGLQGSDPSVLGNWVELADPGDAAAILRAVLLAKGDLVGASAAGSPARIQVGADGLPLVAASGDGTGVHYAQLATGGIADGAVTAAKVAADVATQAELDAEATARAAGDALLIPIAQKGVANGVASLDSGSRVPAAQLPSITISDFLGTVASQAAMLALSGQRGDWAIRSDTSTTWMLIGDDATQLANWKQLATPADAVSSVNGRTGAVTGLAEATDVTAEAVARAAATALLLAKASNLSDVANAATARTNLGLGTAATAASTDFEVAGSVAAEAALRATGDTTRVPNNQTADYTLVLGDAGKVIEVNAATGKNVTVPPNSAVAYPVNTIVWVQQLGAGAATAVAGAGVTLVGASLVTGGVGSGLLLRKTATNTWVVQATSSATSAAAVQVVAHGTDGSVARPAGASAVYWIGSATPVNATASDLWYDGSALLTPTYGQLHSFSSGRYTQVSWGSNFGGPTSMIANRLMLEPLVVHRTVTLDKIGVYVWTGGAAGSVIRCGIYGTTNDLPDALLIDAGTVDSTATGVVTTATFSLTLTPGLYWVGVASQGAPASQPQVLTDPGAPQILSTFSLAEAATTALTNYGKSSVTGAFPSTFGAPAARSGLDAPRVFVRTA